MKVSGARCKVKIPKMYSYWWKQVLQEAPHTRVLHMPMTTQYIQLGN